MGDPWQEERADQARVAAEARMVADAALQREADLRTLMELPAFRRFAWALLGSTGTFRSSFNAEPLRMALAEGARLIGLALHDELHEHCLEAFQAMEREARDTDARFEAAAVPVKDT